MRIDGATGLLCLIGGSVEHSLSPTMYNVAFNRLGLNYVYMVFKVSKNRLGAAIDGFKAIGVKGFNVTTPLKMDVVEFLDRLDPEASKMGVVNTVLNDGGEFVGFNTDGVGAVNALKDKGFRVEGSFIVLLGAGGAGRAIAYAISKKPCKLIILNRTVERAKVLAQEASGGLAEVQWAPLTVESLRKYMPKVDILINATIVGMKPLHYETPVPKRFLRDGIVVFDLVYNPIKTRLLKEAEEAKAYTLDGLDMLLHQGVESFRIWFGTYPPIEPIKRVLDEARRKRLERW